MALTPPITKIVMDDSVNNITRAEMVAIKMLSSKLPKINDGPVANLLVVAAVRLTSIITSHSYMDSNNLLRATLLSNELH